MYRIYANETMICSSKAESTAVLDPVIELEVNSAGTFSFILPPTHPYYDLIQRKTTLVKVYRDEEEEPLFEGICAEESTDFFKQKHITCEGELTFLNDSTLRPSRKQGMTSRELLEAYIAEHNSLVESMKRFTVGQVTAKDSNDSISCYTNYNSTMTEIKEDLIDDIGGYLRVRHENGIRYLDYLKESPRTNNQVIRLGQNLLDLSTNLNSDELATVIIPLGTTLETQTIAGLDERLTIKTANADAYHPSGADYVYSSSAVENYGWIEKVVEWDNVTTVSALLSKGEKYLQDIQFENLVITVKAIDLGLTDDYFQKFKLLDMVRVVSEPHGLDRYFMLSKLSIHLNNPENDSITLGIEEPKSLSAKTQSANEKIKRDIEKLPTNAMVQAAINNATALITGAEGGYVVLEHNANGQPTEIKIQNALENPTKIWRWNQNGIGYSNNGGQSYGLAMTMDGAIVADYITSGTMVADRVKGGTLELGGNSIAANGNITVKDVNGNVIGKWDRDGLDVKKGSLKGASLELGGANNANGTITIKNASGSVIGTWTNAGLSVIGGSITGATISGGQIDQTSDSGGYLQMKKGKITGGKAGENVATINWVDSVAGNYVLSVQSDHEFLINAERVLVGTNSHGVWDTHNNTALFDLPTYINDDGTVEHWQTGCQFIHGMLID